MRREAGAAEGCCSCCAADVAVARLPALIDCGQASVLRQYAGVMWAGVVPGAGRPMRVAWVVLACMVVARGARGRRSRRWVVVRGRMVYEGRKGRVMATDMAVPS